MKATTLDQNPPGTRLLSVLLIPPLAIILTCAAILPAQPSLILDVPSLRTWLDPAALHDGLNSVIPACLLAPGPVLLSAVLGCLSFVRQNTRSGALDPAAIIIGLICGASMLVGLVTVEQLILCEHQDLVQDPDMLRIFAWSMVSVSSVARSSSLVSLVHSR